MAHSDLIGLVAVVGFFGVILVGLLGGLLIVAIRTLKGGPSRRSRAAEADEARLIQEIHVGLTRMEQRVEALETLMLDANKSAGTRTPTT